MENKDYDTFYFSGGDDETFYGSWIGSNFLTSTHAMQTLVFINFIIYIITGPNQELFAKKREFKSTPITDILFDSHILFLGVRTFFLY